MFAHDSIRAFLWVEFPTKSRRRRLSGGKSFPKEAFGRGNEAKKQGL